VSVAPLAATTMAAVAVVRWMPAATENVQMEGRFPALPDSFEVSRIAEIVDWAWHNVCIAGCRH